MFGSQSPSVGPCEGRRIVCALWVIAMLFVSGCAGGDGAHNAPAAFAAPSTPGALPGVRPLGQDANGSPSARTVVAALALRGFFVPNLLDITDQICPAAGCIQSVVSDTMRVTSFSSPSAATHYAQERGLRHWHNIVVAFPPVMSASEQDRYWSAIVEIFP